MKKGPAWEANSHSASFRILQWLIIEFTTAPLDFAFSSMNPIQLLKWSTSQQDVWQELVQV
jgi:hypothetical protein